ncbi:Shr3 amino acid permease chaperone [Armillaria fumosa]|nr:Shr3 amino acid permease chaperone [Armillaria fumosa]
MGLRVSVVVCVTSFLLGQLFTHWIADALTLWKSPVTDENLWIAAAYYSILTKAPVEMYYAMALTVLTGAATILLSLRDGEAGNLMFDGGSICEPSALHQASSHSFAVLFGTTVAMYLYSVIPVVYSSFTALPPHNLTDTFPALLRTATLDLASSNLICSVALTGVLALQAGRFWAETYDVDTQVAPESDTEPHQKKSVTNEPSSL